MLIPFAKAFEEPRGEDGSPHLAEVIPIDELSAEELEVSAAVARWQEAAERTPLGSTPSPAA